LRELSKFGGAVFGAIGKSLGLGLAGMMSETFSKTFLGGAIIGAVEFGLGGFGSGFGASLSSGRSFTESLKAGAAGAAIGAVTGAVIEGSYRAGWQKTLHGLSDEEFSKAQAKSADKTMGNAVKQQKAMQNNNGVLPEDAIGAGSDYYDVLGKKGVAGALQVAEAVVTPSGPFEMIGRFVGGGLGGMIGFGLGLLSCEPGGPIILAIAGNRVGADIGGDFGRRFDNPGAGNAY